MAACDTGSTDGGRLYAVTLNAHNGNPDTTQMVAPGGFAARPQTDPTRMDYAFTDWHTEQFEGEAFEFETTPIYGPRTIHAQWIFRPEGSFLVTFVLNDGVFPQHVFNPQLVSPPTGGALFAQRPLNPTRTGFGFAGWYADSSFNTAFDFYSDEITADINVYARWRQPRVTFDTGGGSPPPGEQIILGDWSRVVRPPVNPQKSRHVFVDWQVEGEQIPFNFPNRIVEGDITLVAQWRPMQHGVDWAEAPDSTFPSGVPVHAIAWGNGRFVAVGGNWDNGHIAHSADGITWQTVTTSAFDGNQVNAIVWGNNKFVAGGQDGNMAYSADGLTWTAIEDSTFPDGSTIRGIARSGGINARFVAVGSGGRMAHSSDGLTWQSVANSQLLSTANTGAIVWVNFQAIIKFVAGGGTRMVHSTDGLNWTIGSSNFNGVITSITFGASRFVAGTAGGIHTSTNGTAWGCL